MGKKRVPEDKVEKEGRESEKIRKLEKEIRRLKSENRTLKHAWETTEKYLVDISRDKTINDIFQEIVEKADKKIEGKCPNCSSELMKRINLGAVQIICCSDCDYRNRVNGKGTSQI